MPEEEKNWKIRISWLDFRFLRRLDNWDKLIQFNLQIWEMRLITFCEILQIGFYFILKRPASELKIYAYVGNGQQ